ncbi:AsmA family protein [Rhodobacteraceae bacterium N5(2021)]|uniref:AsmA family protein n=1 Tax=Gymnodinialimonas phycosphaerae TaxID=2841589 RepID=A0A975YFR4_9RHOB|nr:AsmA-like C-terminal region-containing protein [Gymnodinialimonas phycosphaerae]MBY4895060.1 AsmA family protein [Gymnodinialimonas phycosphaerae]
MRWIIRIVGAFVVLLFLALGAFLLIPADRIAEVASDRITAATGRTVTITGEARPTLWPDLGIVIEGLRIDNPTWAGDAPMIEADRVNVGVAWNGLFSGDIRVERAVLEGASIMLVRAADGRTSWDMGTGGGDGESARPMQVGFDEAIIRGARVRYLDREAGSDWQVAQMDATVRLPEAGGAVEIEGNAQINGVPVVLDTIIDGVAGLLAGDARPVVATLRWQGGSVAFDGQLGLDATAEGAMDLTAEDLGPLVALAGGAMPDLPQGLGRDRIAVTGDLRLAQEGSVHLRGGQLRLDDTLLNIAADLVPGEDRPMLRGTITGGEIALPGLLASDAEATGSGWPRDVIDVSGLFATDADLTVRAENLDLGAVALSEIDLRATLTRGRLVFDIASIRTYEGQLAGRFVINGRGGLSVGGDLVLSDVALQPLMTAMAGYERLEGTGSASIEFLGVGNDLYTIMDGLEAEGDIALGQGAIIGLDLAGMIRNFDPSFQGEGQRTVYDRVTAEYLVRDGIVRNEDLLLDAPWGEVRGAGEADLAAMTVDYTLVPGIFRDAEGVADIRVPIAVRGPWSAPQIAPDLALLAEMELAEERARLEAEGRAALEAEEERLEELARDRANALLGTEIEAGDTPEDIEEQLTEELINGVQQLIFGNQGETE